MVGRGRRALASHNAEDTSIPLRLIQSQWWQVDKAWLRGKGVSLEGEQTWVGVLALPQHRQAPGDTSSPRLSVFAAKWKRQQDLPVVGAPSSPTPD